MFFLQPPCNPPGCLRPLILHYRFFHLPCLPGCQVVLVDTAAAQLKRATAGMQASLAKLAAKGRLPGGAEPEAVMARLQPATELEVGR